MAKNQLSRGNETRSRFGTRKGDLLPDDDRYTMIVLALDTIAESSETSDAEELSWQVSAPDSTYELTQWLTSHYSRPTYVDDAVSELGMPSPTDGGGVLAMIAMGWHAEFREVFDSVLSSLREHLEGGESL